MVNTLTKAALSAVIKHGDHAESYLIPTFKGKYGINAIVTACQTIRDSGAPELLEILELLVSDECTAPDYLIKAKAVIAKAKGEA